MNNRSSLFYILAIFISLCFACSNDDMIPDPKMEEMEMMDIDTMMMDDDMFEVSNLLGTSQKGPYLVGSNVTLLEIEDNFSPTGRSFAEDITDNLGSFEFDNLQLASSFVEIRASGFYFNEVTNENSDAQLNLSAIVDLTDQESINVNILTTLEKRRVEHLIGQGNSFSDAKEQATEEILRVFEIDNSISQA